jgi:activating signal cointegrator 1
LDSGSRFSKNRNHLLDITSPESITMKAITLTQPWATLVALGEKKIETRSWACYYPGPLAIHAAKAYKKCEYAALMQEQRFIDAIGGNHVVLGCVIAITSVTRCVRMGETGYPSRDDSTLIPLFTPKEMAFGHYAPGRFAWILGPVQRIKPVPAVGHQLLWDWDAPYEVIP